MKLKPPNKRQLRVFAIAITAVMCTLVILSAVFPFPEGTYDFLSIGTSQKVAANPGTLEGWPYHKTIPITGATGAGANYQVKVTVYKGAGTDSGGVVYLGNRCTNFPTDISVTDNDGETELYHWYEINVGSNTTYRVYWIKVNDSLESGTVNICIYYGKYGGSSAYLSAANTFIKYHGAESADFHDTNAALGTQIRYRARVRATLVSHNVLWGLADMSGAYDNGLTIQTWSGGTLRYAYAEKDTVSTQVSESPAFTANTWYILDITYNTTWARGFVDNNQIGTDITTNLPTADLGLWMWAPTGTNAQDWSFVGKFVSPEPTVGTAGAEVLSDFSITKYPSNPILSPTTDNTYHDARGMREPRIYKDGGTYYLHYDGCGQAVTDPYWTICRAHATTLEGPWTKDGRVLEVGTAGAWDDSLTSTGTIVKSGDTYYMFYVGAGSVSDDIPTAPYDTGVATSSSITGNWTKYGSNPILSGAGGTAWDKDWACMTSVIPAPVASNYTWMGFYAGSKDAIFQIGIAYSNDLYTWVRYGSNPIISALPDSYNIENPEVFQLGTTWYMAINNLGDPTYTTNDLLYRATNSNLTSWEYVCQVVSPETSGWDSGAIGITSTIVEDEVANILYDASNETTHWNRKIGLQYLREGWVDLDPTTQDFDVLEVNTTSNTAINYFTLNNTGNCPVDVVIYGTDLIGGDDTWDLSDTATPGENIYGLYAGLDDADDLFDIIVRETTTYNTLVSDLADGSTQAWGLKIYMPTSLNGYDNQEMAGTITLVVSEAT